MFKLWSQSSKDIEIFLSPDLWIRTWNDLSADEKQRIWRFLGDYLFDKEHTEYDHRSNTQEYIFPIVDDYLNKDISQALIELSIERVNEMYKHKSYWERYLQHKSLHNAALDFYNIFNYQDGNLVLELLSIYSNIFITWNKNTRNYLAQYENEEDEIYTRRFVEYQYYYFDKFTDRLNEVFKDFGLNVILSRQWFIPRQWEEITTEIYKPTLGFLCNSKFIEVNRDLWDAFSDYHTKDYSWCVTKVISAIQAFLQISVRWEIWKGDIAELINEAIKTNLIPDDIFTKTIFDNIKSVIMRERQETADSHPKKEYANEQNARLIMNLSMVFIQHFLQLKK